MSDKRLEGKVVKDITIKFVEENATDDEIQDAVAVKELGTDRKYIQGVEYPDSDCEGDVVVDWFEDTLSLLKDYHDNGDIVKLEYGFDGNVDIEVYRNVPIIQTLTGVKALQYLWKEQIKADLKEKEEYDKYIELKSKFEGGDYYE